MRFSLCGVSQCSAVSLKPNRNIEVTMLRIIVGMLLISVSMTTISSIGPGFEGRAVHGRAKDFFMAEMIFTVGVGIGLPIMLWGIADTAIRR